MSIFLLFIIDEMCSNGEDINVTVTHLENNSSNTSLISKRNSSNEKLLSINVTDVLVKQCGNPSLLKKKKSKTQDRDIQEALTKCLIDMGDSDDDYSYEKSLENEIVKCSVKKKQPNGHTGKRNNLLSNSRDNSFNCVTPIKTMQAIDNIQSISLPKLTAKIPIALANLPFTVVNSYTLIPSPQRGVCLTLPPNIEKCINCRFHQIKTSVTGVKSDYNEKLCRFVAFRLLKYNKSRLYVAGFKGPLCNVNASDFIKWLPNELPYTSLNGLILQASIQILENAGGYFCKLVQEEKETFKLGLANKMKKKCEILWKKSVNESCDVCKALIFHYHWTCSKCGFVVCADCFRKKLNDSQLNLLHSLTESRNNKNWLPCSNKKEHNVHQITITQNLPEDVLNRVSELMHTVCTHQNIQLNCNCITKLKNQRPPIVPNSSDSDTTFDGVFKNNICKEITKTSHSLSLLKNMNLNDLTSKPEKNISKEEVKPSTIKIFTKELSFSLNKSKVLHMWRCGELILDLLEPMNPNNYGHFQVFKNKKY